MAEQSIIGRTSGDRAADDVPDGNPRFGAGADGQKRTELAVSPENSRREMSQNATSGLRDTRGCASGSGPSPSSGHSGGGSSALTRWLPRFSRWHLSGLPRFSNICGEHVAADDARGSRAPNGPGQAVVCRSRKTPGRARRRMI